MVKVLADVKDILNVSKDDDGFDAELLTDINSSMAAFSQVGTIAPIQLIDADTDWDTVLSPDDKKKNETSVLLKQYVYLKTKVLFDPPQPTTLSAMNEAAKELLWRSEQLLTPDELERR